MRKKKNKCRQFRADAILFNFVKNFAEMYHINQLDRLTSPHQQLSNIGGRET